MMMQFIKIFISKRSTSLSSNHVLCTCHCRRPQSKTLFTHCFTKFQKSPDLLLFGQVVRDLTQRAVVQQRVDQRFRAETATVSNTLQALAHHGNVVVQRKTNVGRIDQVQLLQFARIISGKQRNQQSRNGFFQLMNKKMLRQIFFYGFFFNSFVLIVFVFNP